MRLYFSLLTILIFTSGSAFANDQDIKQKIINESISTYSGNCPCPYNSARNGSRCGGRSAYSRKGGASPICYEADITKEMIEEYKARN
jgi:hypothetical protein